MVSVFEENVLFFKSNPDKKVERDDKLKDGKGFYCVLGEIQDLIIDLKLIILLKNVGDGFRRRVKASSRI